MDPPESTSTRALLSAREADTVLDAETAQLDVPRNPTALLMELVYDDADTSPWICRDALGTVVPIPTLPFASMRIDSFDPFVTNEMNVALPSFVDVPFSNDN